MPRRLILEPRPGNTQRAEGLPCNVPKRRAVGARDTGDHQRKRNVRYAYSIEAAIDSRTAGGVDIVLSDLVLRRRPNGIDLAHWTVRHQPATKLILMSETVPLVPTSSAISVVMPVLMKPVDESALLTRLEAMSAFLTAAAEPA